MFTLKLCLNIYLADSYPEPAPILFLFLFLFNSETTQYSLRMASHLKAGVDSRVDKLIWRSIYRMVDVLGMGEGNSLT